MTAMSTVFRLFLLPLIALGGYLLAKRWPTVARRSCEGMLFVSAVSLSTLAISGAWHGNRATGQLHRWLGHILVIIVWLSVPAMCGIFFRWRYQLKTPRMTVAIVFLILLLVATVLGSMTGYLDWVGDDLAAQESHNRFVVLHFFFFPACMAALLAGIWWTARSSGTAS